ncbi:MAG: hypothetical protein BWZ10_03522 [candidate division BRC1 bacterium ADurb.BinA364]|nr:MAG: hypothetical protein BWZ10_03522 [candidate division BRC1 bacterium ADurb.BinA364]
MTRGQGDESRPRRERRFDVFPRDRAGDRRMQRHGRDAEVFERRPRVYIRGIVLAAIYDFIAGPPIEPKGHQIQAQRCRPQQRYFVLRRPQQRRRRLARFPHLGPCPRAFLAIFCAAPREIPQRLRRNPGQRRDSRMREKNAMRRNRKHPAPLRLIVDKTQARHGPLFPSRRLTARSPLRANARDAR